MFEEQYINIIRILLVIVPHVLTIWYNLNKSKNFFTNDFIWDNYNDHINFPAIYSNYAWIERVLLTYLARHAAAKIIATKFSATNTAEKQVMSQCSLSTESTIGTFRYFATCEYLNKNFRDKANTMYLAEIGSDTAWKWQITIDKKW